MKIILFAVLIILAFLVISQVTIILKARRNKGRKIEEVPGQIGRRINQGEDVLLYFYSPSCRACKAQTPIFNRIKKQFRNAFEVDVSKDGAMARKFNVMGTPSIVWIEKGTIKEFWVGLRQEEQLLKLVQKTEGSR
ncbi:MAG: thioredoxin family protein [Calditrichaeota bacterium]|nr:thioredoxin family protein [Calditrichota bacterium]